MDKSFGRRTMSVRAAIFPAALPPQCSASPRRYPRSSETLFNPISSEALSARTVFAGRAGRATAPGTGAAATLSSYRMHSF